MPKSVTTACPATRRMFSGLMSRARGGIGGRQAAAPAAARDGVAAGELFAQPLEPVHHRLSRVAECPTLRAGGPGGQGNPNYGVGACRPRTKCTIRAITAI